MPLADLILFAAAFANLIDSHPDLLGEDPGVITTLGVAFRRIERSLAYILEGAA